MSNSEPTWVTSTHSGQGNCVEVAGHGRRVLVRDTQDRPGPVLRFSPAAWRRFAGQVKRSLAPGRSRRVIAMFRLEYPRRLRCGVWV